LVVHPVLSVSAGGYRASMEAISAYREALIPLAFALTPNLREAEALVGPRDNRQATVLALLELGPMWVVLKGGHGEGEECEDIISDGSQWFSLRSRRLRAKAHGTGCVHAAHLAAALALGQPMPDAASAARQKVVEMLTRVENAGMTSTVSL